MVTFRRAAHTARHEVDSGVEALPRLKGVPVVGAPAGVGHRAEVAARGGGGVGEAGAMRYVGHWPPRATPTASSHAHLRELVLGTS